MTFLRAARVPASSAHQVPSRSCAAVDVAGEAHKNAPAKRGACRVEEPTLAQGQRCIVAAMLEAVRCGSERKGSELERMCVLQNAVQRVPAVRWMLL